MASDSSREQFLSSLTSQHSIEEFMEIFKRKTFAVKHRNNFKDRIY